MGKKRQSFVQMLGVFVSLSLGTFSYAGKVETVVVDSGYVVAYGEYIPPPYRITLKQGPVVENVPHDSIFINDILYSPSLRNPDIKYTSFLSKRPKEYVEKLNKLSKRTFAIEDSVSKLIERYGVKEATPKIDNLLQACSSVVKEWNISEEEYKVVYYFEHKGEIETFPLRRMPWPPQISGTPGGETVGKDEQHAQRWRDTYIKMYKEIIKRFGQGQLVIRGYGYTVDISPRDPQQWLLSVKSVVKENIPDSLKKELLKGKDLPDNLAEEILMNKESWKRLNLK